MGENQAIKLEVGIEDWLHLIFDVKRNKFSLKDCIDGQVTFKKVGLRLKGMEIQIIKKETIGAGSMAQSETDINNRFSVQYFLNLVLMDVEDRRYFKQHEIQMF